MTPADRAQVAAWLVDTASTALATDIDLLRDHIDLARREGVSGLLCDRWRATIDGDDPRAALLSAEIGRQVASELIRSGAERRVLAALNAAGIDALVLKGAALARWLYAHAHWRPRSDLDLLFASEADSARAEQALGALGYRWDGVLANGVCVERTLIGSPQGVVHAIDLHWRLTPHPVYADRFTYAELWTDRVPLPDLERGVGLGDVHALIHAALHRFANRLVGEEDRLIWLYDIHLLAARLDSARWSALAACAQAHAVAAPLLDALTRTSTLLGTAIDPVVISALAESAPRESFQVDNALDRRLFEMHALRRMPPRQRLQHAWRQVFPSVAYMRQRYGADSLLSVARAYVRRMFDGLKLLLRG